MTSPLSYEQVVEKYALTDDHMVQIQEAERVHQLHDDLDPGTYTVLHNQIAKQICISSSTLEAILEWFYQHEIEVKGSKAMKNQRTPRNIRDDMTFAMNEIVNASADLEHRKKMVEKGTNNLYKARQVHDKLLNEYTQALTPEEI